jgi:hypothetical protein
LTGLPVRVSTLGKALGSDVAGLTWVVQRFYNAEGFAQETAERNSFNLATVVQRGLAVLALNHTVAIVVDEKEPVCAWHQCRHGLTGRPS